MSTAGDVGQSLLLMEEHERYALLNTDDTSSITPPPPASTSTAAAAASTSAAAARARQEQQAVGGLGWGVYHSYISSIGYWIAFLVLVALMAMQFSRWGVGGGGK